jgi:murein DD-endopeptidase MepM/ murein hydrolase activator NlpD
MRVGRLSMRVLATAGVAATAAAVTVMAVPQRAAADSILPAPLASPVAGLLAPVKPVVNQVPVVGQTVSSATQAVTGPGAQPAQGGGAATSSPTPAQDPAQGGGQPPQPSPAEQAALPPEPGRVVLEQQQQTLADQAAPIDQVVNGPGADMLVAQPGGTLGWPIVFRGRPPITQPFGCTDVPGEPYDANCPSHRRHTGIDLGIPLATPIYASSGGTVREFVSGSGYGDYVLISHPDGWFTLYGHLSSFVVADGQVVQKGQLIARSGSTGYSTGPHLHFEVRRGSQAVDPCGILNCSTTSGSA